VEKRFERKGHGRNGGEHMLVLNVNFTIELTDPF
jgi:hypothetical protein